MIEPRLGLRDVVRTSVLQEGRYERLRLDKNEHTSGFPQAVVDDMLKGVTPHFLAAYPEPAALYRKIAAMHDLDVGHVLVTAGSEMAIRYLFEAYLDAGDEVVLVNPSFAMFDVYARICRAVVVAVDVDRQMAVTAGSIIARIGPRTKIVAIANPNNPTGTAISEADLLRIVEAAAAHNALALVDEAYFHFYPGTLVPWLPQHDNLVVTRTFSKACGLAGMRLGYALAHPAVVSAMATLQPIDVASNFALKLGEYLLDHPDLVRSHVRQVEDGKAWLLSALARLGLPARGSAANFVIVDLGAARSEVVEALAREGVLVGASLRLPFDSNYVRVTVGSEAQMGVLVAAIERALAAPAGATTSAVGRSES